MSDTILYTAIATATHGRDGRARSSDGRLDVRLVTPKEMGGTEAEGTNPEQMFAAGYAACFSSAMRLVAQRMKLDVEDSSVTAEIGIGPRDGAVGFRLHATLRVELPDLAEEDAKALVERTHQVCPYSNALREGVDVELVIE